MASLNMRYKGNVVQVPEGGVYDPQSYGTKRLNVKVNSIKTMRFGLTTNPNAKDYCPLQIRVGGQIGFIGRVSSTQYNSGDPVDYNGSVVGSRSTSLYTEEGIINANSGSGTTADNPGIRTITNATGSSITSKTASEAIQYQTATWYSFKYQHSNTNNGSFSTKAASAMQSSYSIGYRTYTQYHTQILTVANTNYNIVTSVQNMINIGAFSFVNVTETKTLLDIQNKTVTVANNLIQIVKSTNQELTTVYTQRYNSSFNNAGLVLKTNVLSNNVVKNYTTSMTYQLVTSIVNTTVRSTGAIATRATRVISILSNNFVQTRTGANTYNYNYSQYSYKSTTKVNSNTYTLYNVTNIHSTVNKSSMQPIQTYYSYATSTRYSYSWTSHERITNSTTKVSETIHNINL